MAGVLTLDAVSQMQIVESSTGIRIMRTGWVKGLRTFGLPSNEIAANVTNPTYVPGFPALLSAYPAARYASAKLRQVVISGIERNNDKVDIMLIYDSTMGIAPIPVTFVLSRRTTTVIEETELHPGTRQPFLLSWINPANGNDTVFRTGRIRYRRPHQVLVADGYYIGEPPAGMIAGLRCVNDAPWRGYPKGYWMFTEQSDVTRDFGGSYNITLQLETRIDRDWSEWETIGDHYGRVLKLDQDEINDVESRPYNYGVYVGNGFPSHRAVSDRRL
jgi:hypothetical protein